MAWALRKTVTGNQGHNIKKKAKAYSGWQIKDVWGQGGGGTGSQKERKPQ